MKFSSTKKSLFSAVLLSVYIFVAFFASNLHQHGSSLVFKDFHFKKTEKSVEHSHHDHAEYTDCLSCHLVHNGKNLVPQEFSYDFSPKFEFRKQFFAYQQKFSDVQIYFLRLRGPPSA